MYAVHKENVYVIIAGALVVLGVQNLIKAPKLA